ncbi:MAG: hypothetical protein WCS52_04270 [bacterium]
MMKLLKLSIWVLLVSLSAGGGRVGAGEASYGAAYQAGQSFEKAKKWVEARAEYEKALAVPGNTPDQTGEALLNIAAGYHAENKFLLERQTLEKVLSLAGISNAEKVKAHLALGGLFVCYGDWAKVKPELITALNIPGISIEQKAAAQQALAKTLMNLREYAAARTLLKELVVNEALPDDVRTTTQVLIGKSLMLERNYAEARTEFAKVLAMTKVSNPVKAEIQLYVGLSYYEAQDYARAKLELTKVLTMPGAEVRAPWDGGRIAYQPAREAMLRLRLRNLGPDDNKILKVLFIGSSHTYRGDIPGLVMQLAASAPTNQPRIIAGDYLRMGTTINTFWNAGDTPDTARGVITSEPWDTVVFESFYSLKSEELMKYGALFSDLIHSNHANAVIYETPIAQAKPYPDGYRKYHDDSMAMVKVLKAPVAPSVLAWMQFLGPAPTAEQFGVVYADWIHATPKGAYITACGMYAALTGCSPVGLYHPQDISESDALKFQQLAWNAYRETNFDVKL